MTNDIRLVFEEMVQQHFFGSRLVAWRTRRLFRLPGVACFAVVETPGGRRVRTFVVISQYILGDKTMLVPIVRHLLHTLNKRVYMTRL